MAKSILTPEGDLVNYDNLIAVSVEVRPVGVDEEHISSLSDRYSRLY